MVEDRIAETDQGADVAISADGLLEEEARDSVPKQNCGRPEGGGAIRCDPHDSTKERRTLWSRRRWRRSRARWRRPVAGQGPRVCTTAAPPLPAKRVSIAETGSGDGGGQRARESAQQQRCGTTRIGLAQSRWPEAIHPAAGPGRATATCILFHREAAGSDGGPHRSPVPPVGAPNAEDRSAVASWYSKGPL